MRVRGRPIDGDGDGRVAHGQGSIALTDPSAITTPVPGTNEFVLHVSDFLLSAALRAWPFARLASSTSRDVREATVRDWFAAAFACSAAVFACLIAAESGTTFGFHLGMSANALLAALSFEYPSTSR
ncbi:hypothetical protein [Cellulomonas sp. S1-8]|uniref:hypothetical protein n=1 Tax=Cellulomonas sp. S1-8 TaxID=2904790 RepID=UPI00224420D8|nr:hypothetical protein [Cellulomonas sp. S1-8]UZN02622.1 hypothetical protein OKX07_16425 [Cellulomonas sp. S1-8]